jgi:hypothetical protein
MVDLGDECHLGRITNVSRRAVIQSWNMSYRWCFERKIFWKRKFEGKRASLVRAVWLHESQNQNLRSVSENNAPPPLWNTSS